MKLEITLFAIAVIIVGALIYGGYRSIVASNERTRERYIECREKTNDIEYCFKAVYGRDVNN